MQSIKQLRDGLSVCGLYICLDDKFDVLQTTSRLWVVCPQRWMESSIAFITVDGSTGVLMMPKSNSNSLG